jgi:hypothetical protein
MADWSKVNLLDGAARDTHKALVVIRSLRANAKKGDLTTEEAVLQFNKAVLCLKDAMSNMVVWAQTQRPEPEDDAEGGEPVPAE